MDNDKLCGNNKQEPRLQYRASKTTNKAN